MKLFAKFKKIMSGGFKAIFNFQLFNLKIGVTKFAFEI